MRMPAPLLMAVLSASFVRLSVAHQQPPTLKAEKSQTAESSAPTQKRPPQIAGRVIHDDTLVTLDFPGGTIESYAGAIRKAAQPDSLNLFVDSDAAEIPVPPIKLTKASIYDSLSLVARSGKAPDGRYLNVGVQVLESTAVGGSAVYKVRADYMESPGFVRPPEVSLEVLSLNPIIGLPGSTRADRPPLDVKAVLGAIESAVAVAVSDASTPPVLKFHEASGLLFVKGTSEQRNVAIEVVRQLRNDVDAQEATLDVISASRTTVNLPLKGTAGEEILAGLRKYFERSCCVQFWTDGNTLVIAGDKALVNEAAKRASILDLQSMDKTSKQSAPK